MRRSTLVVVLLAALTFFAGLGRGAIADSDEAFYAESAREMVESGDWITPSFNYEPRFQKPALYYWLTAGVYLIAGPTEFAARFWSAMAGLGLALLTAAAGRRWFDETTATLAGAIAATNFGYFALARMALPDLPLAFFITLTIWAALVATLERPGEPGRWLLAAAGSAALGFLAKGPLAVLIPTLVVLPILLIERRTFAVRGRDIAVAIAVFLVIAVPWYAVMWRLHGLEYLEGFFVGDNLERFSTTRFNDPRPWWFYAPVVAGGLLPWTPLALLWLGPIWRGVTRHRAVSALDVRLLVWVLAPLVFFTLSIGKQPRYVLPVLPPLALLLARSIAEQMREWRGFDGGPINPPARQLFIAGGALAGLLLAALAVLLYRARILFIAVPEPATVTVSAVIGLAGAAVIATSLTSAWRRTPAVLAAAAAITMAGLPYGALPAAADAPVQDMARLVAGSRSAGEAVATYHVFVRNLVFYTQQQHMDVIHDDHLVEWLAKNPRAIIVMPAADADRLARERGLALERVAARSYFDDGSLRVGTLLWPDPARDLEQVVLVRHGGEAGDRSSVRRRPVP